MICVCLLLTFVKEVIQILLTLPCYYKEIYSKKSSNYNRENTLFNRKFVRKSEKCDKFDKIIAKTFGGNQETIYLCKRFPLKRAVWQNNEFFEIFT